jgi:hypothetical protein
MKVKELIEKLALLDQEMPVMVLDWAGDVTPVKLVNVTEVALDAGCDIGTHVDVSLDPNGQYREMGYPIVNAVIVTG